MICFFLSSLIIGLMYLLVKNELLLLYFDVPYYKLFGTGSIRPSLTN